MGIERDLAGIEASLDLLGLLLLWHWDYKTFFWVTLGLVIINQFLKISRWNREQDAQKDKENKEC